MATVVSRALALALLVLLPQITTAQTQATAQAAIEPNKAQLRQEEALIARIWWNQASKIEALSLTDTQRGKMDEVFRPFLRTYNKRFQQIQEERVLFAGALYEHDFEAAEELRKKVVEYQSDFVSQQVQVMMDIAQLLTEEQLASLGKDFRKLFTRSWVRPFSKSGQGQGKARPKPAGK